MTVRSERGYTRQWDKWVEFLRTVESEKRPQTFLQDVEVEEDKAKWIVWFIAFLIDQKGVRGVKAVGGILVCLKFQWKAKGSQEGRGDQVYTSLCGDDDRDEGPVMGSVGL